PAAAIALDVSPRQLIALAGDRLDGWKGWRLRQWRYGPAACKVDYLLSGPVPWTNEACRQAGVVHLGGRFEDIASAERTTSAGSLGHGRLVLRPWGVLDPYRTPLPGVRLCSASTPPGAGAHGMCGWHAAGRILSARARRSRTA